MEMETGIDNDDRTPPTLEETDSLSYLLKDDEDFLNDLIQWGQLKMDAMVKIFASHLVFPSFLDLYEAQNNKQKEEELKNLMKSYGIDDQPLLEKMIFDTKTQLIPTVQKFLREFRDVEGTTLFQEGAPFLQSYETRLKQLRQMKKEGGIAIGKIKSLLKSNAPFDPAKISLKKELARQEFFHKRFDEMYTYFKKLKTLQFIGTGNPRKRSEWLKFLIRDLVDYVESARKRVIQYKATGDAQYTKKTTIAFVSVILSGQGIANLTIKKTETYYENALKAKR